MNLEPIDTSTTAGKAEVMRLASEGRKVATTNLSGEWQECSLPEWAWDSYDYAIIAEPVGPDEVWVGFHPSGFISGTSKFPHKGMARYIRADLAGEVV